MNKALKDISVGAFCIITGVLLCFAFFQIPDWDFFAYHYHNGWAFLNNRMDIDSMPCMFRTYFNPLLDIVLYSVVHNLNEHPIIITLLTSIKFSVFLFLAYKTCSFLFNKFAIKDRFSIWVCLISTALSPILILCSFSLGYADVYISILILCGLYIYLQNIFQMNKNRLIFLFIASFLMEISFGIKYTSFAYLAALGITTLLFYKKIFSPLKTLICIAGGMFAGFISSGGYWMLILYKKFQNPLFPYFNNVFKSPMADADAVIGNDFAHLLPKSVLEFIFYPLKYFTSDRFIGVEHVHFDLKIPFAFIFIICSFILLNLIKRKKIKLTVEGNDYFYLILLFTSLTYYINLLLFANIRYVIVLFVFIPLIICEFLHILIENKKIYYYAIALIFAASFATYDYSGLPMRKWKDATKVLETADLKIEDGSTVLFSFMTCFIAPDQNPKAKYIGYTLQKDLAKSGYWQDSYKNKYFSNKYNEGVIQKSVDESNHVYFIFSLNEIGRDLKAYKASLKRYLNEDTALNHCRVIRYYAYDNSSPKKNIFICKIK